MKRLTDFSFFLLKLLPFPVYYFIADFLFYLIYYVIRYRRSIVRKNITQAFPTKNLDNVRSIEKNFYLHLADYIVESVAMARMTESDFLKHFHYINLELFDTFLKQGKNVLLVTGHYGNWEWMGSLTLFSKNLIYAVYKEQSNRFINSAMLYSREKFGMHLLPYPRLYKEILSMPPDKRVGVIILADQRPAMDNKGQWIEFMNQQITYFRGLENLHKVMKGVVLYTQVLKTSRGNYTVEFIPLTPNPPEENSGDWLTKKFFKALEENIRIDPAYYLWSHNRWKFVKPPESSMH